MITIYTTPAGLLQILDHKPPTSWSFQKEGLNVCEMRISEEVYRTLLLQQPKQLLKD